MMRGKTQSGPYSAEPIYWMKLRNTTLPSERLDPGGNAKAIFRRWNPQTLQYEDVLSQRPHHGEVDVWDWGEMNFLLPGEIFQARLNTSSATYEIIGSQGLKRKARVGPGVTILPDLSGVARLFVAGAVTNPLQTVTAYHDWIKNGDPVEDEADMILWYFRDENHWSITNAKCPE